MNIVLSYNLFLVIYCLRYTDINKMITDMFLFRNQSDTVNVNLTVIFVIWLFLLCCILIQLCSLMLCRFRLTLAVKTLLISGTLFLLVFSCLLYVYKNGNHYGYFYLILTCGLIGYIIKYIINKHSCRSSMNETYIVSQVNIVSNVNEDIV